MAEIKMEVEGIEEVDLLFRRASEALEPEVVEEVLREGAEIFADAIRAKAPLGPTGNLKESVRAIVLKRRGQDMAAMATIDRKKAPHAHLVEYGTSERFQKKSGKSVGRMPRHPFFRPAYDENREKVQEFVTNRIKEKVEA